MAAMSSAATALATKKLKDIAAKQINADLSRANEIKNADVLQVKQDTVDALNQLQSSVINSLTRTETYALGQCLNRCKTAAKSMIAAHDLSMNSQSLSGAGRRKKRRTNKKRTNKRRTNKRRTNKKYH
jgi:hypothetical protein